MLSETQLTYCSGNTVPRSLPIIDQSFQHFQKQTKTKHTKPKTNNKTTFSIKVSKILLRYRATASLGRPKPDINNSETEGFYLLGSNTSVTLYQL